MQVRFTERIKIERRRVRAQKALDSAAASGEAPPADAQAELHSALEDLEVRPLVAWCVVIGICCPAGMHTTVQLLLSVLRQISQRKAAASLSNFT